MLVSIPSLLMLGSFRPRVRPLLSKKNPKHQHMEHHCNWHPYNSWLIDYLGLRIKTIHTHVQLTHNRHRTSQNYHIFIIGSIPSSHRYTLRMKNTYDIHRTSYLCYTKPHNYNMLHNAPFLKSQT